MRNVRQSVGPQRAFPGHLVALAFFFALGVILGQVFAAQSATDVDSELYRYLSDFFQVSDQVPGGETFLSTALLYLRYPVLAFLLGFASVGVVGLPVLSAVFGFFLSFSVCCFASAFGSDGVLLALSVFGLRCVLTLPCYFLLAVPAFRNAVSLAAISFNGGKRVAPVVYGSAYFLRFCLCLAVLLVGIAVELTVAPQLLAWVCGRIFA